ncbi:MAG TPA: translocation/assembly module TamB domain-containing protein [Gammaproteobacteria bacterium]|nr:translocation/assembly module TamB domain-containing protein [Gammaproteobacteria bacterium]
MKWRRVLLGAAALIVLAAVAVGSSLLWIVRTDSGTSWILRQIAARAGPALELGAVSGTLLDGISVSGVRIVLADAEIDIDALTVRASLSELFARRLVIYELSAGAVSYSQTEAPGDEASDAGTALDLPVSIELRRATIGALDVATSEAELAFGATSFTGELEGSALRLTNLTTSTSGVSIEGDASLELTDPLGLAAEFSWSMEIDGIAWSGSGRASGSLAAIAFEHRLDAPFPVTADGEVTLGDAPRAEVRLAWEALSWPGFDLAQSPSGSVELSGWLERIEFTGSGQAIVADTSLTFSATGSATPETVAFAELAIGSELGEADIEGDIELDSMSFDLNVAARGIDPGRFVAGWPGEIEAEGRARGSVEPELRWSVSELEIGGTLRDIPVAGSGGVASSAPGEWQLDDVELSWGANRTSVSGDIGSVLDLAVRLDAPELGAVLAGVDGHLMLDGELGGSLDTPAFTGTATIDGFAAGNVSADRISVDGRVSARQEAEVAVRFEAEGIAAARPIIETLTGNIDGTTASHTVTVDVRPRTGAGSLSATGSWDGESWTGEIESAVLEQELLGIWSLAEPTGLSVSPASIVLEYACLEKESANLCLGARFGTDDDQLDLTVDSFDIAWLEPLIAEPVTIAGLYDASVSLRGSLSRPIGTASVRGRSSAITINDAQAPLTIPVNDIAIDAELTESRLDASAGFRTAADTSVEISGSLIEIWTPAPELDVIVEGTWANLSVLTLLSPDIGDVSGAANFSLAVTGPLEAPQVQGEASWTDGEIAVPLWGLVVEDVDASVSSDTGRELVYSVTAAAGGGTIRLTGETLLDPQSGWPTNLSVSGENLEAVQLPEAQIVVSPDLDVFTAWPTINVTGTVVIPSAALNLDALPAQGVTTSDDVVVHGVEAEAPPRPLEILADLRLVLGEDVRLTGSGLDAQVEGELNLDYGSGQPTFATGTLTLAGDYATFGQTLELDRGQLLFAGEVTNPTLDIRGIRRFETSGGEVEVGVLVTGTLREPVTRLYAEPSMSDGDIISYLAVGRPLSDSSRENSEALQAAALSLGITQALPQIQHFGEAIGLDELGVRTSEANTGELMAGKQVNSRMYVRYTYGLINRIGGLLLRFRLTDNLSLEARSGEYQAMDLLYTIERD